MIDRALGLVDRLSGLAAMAALAMLLALLAVMLHEVVARYVFNAPSLWGSDLATMLNGCLFLLGAGWTLAQGGHVRIDFLSARLPLRAQNAVNALFYAGLLLPALGAIAWVAWRKAAQAWATGEIDLAMAWKVPIWPFYGLIALALALFWLQVLAETVRHLRGLRAGAAPPSLRGG